MQSYISSFLQYKIIFLKNYCICFSNCGLNTMKTHKHICIYKQSTKLLVHKAKPISSLQMCHWAYTSPQPTGRGLENHKQKINN